jgi:hypothetical protein
MQNPDKKRKKEKPKEQKKDAVSLLLTGLTIMGVSGSIKGATDTYQNMESLKNSNYSLVENHKMVANYKNDPKNKAKYKAEVKTMNQKLSDQLKKGNSNFGIQAPVEVPPSYGESEQIIKQHIGQAKFGIVAGGINSLASGSFAIAVATLNKLRDIKKNKKNKKD